MTWQGPNIGIAQEASLFVAVLGASNYTYAEATRDPRMDRWLLAQVKAFEYFGRSAAAAFAGQHTNGR